MKNNTVRPNYLRKEHLEFLDGLRETGITNMFGAAPYLQEEYPELDRKQSHDVLSYWMTTFSKRHNLESK